MSRKRSKMIRTAANVLMVVGVILLVVAAVYWVIPADKLPSLLGHMSKTSAHRTQRATLATIAGVVVIAGAILLRVRSKAR
jgi:multisubunit Na+/H+ antiporter MnhB subunit